MSDVDDLAKLILKNKQSKLLLEHRILELLHTFIIDEGKDKNIEVFND